MKFTSAIASVVGLATAANLQQDATYNADYVDYFTYPEYVQPDYTAEWTDGSLPGPDYNRQCYEFDTCNQIFTQDQYNDRVLVEAELLVGLEALKESIMILNLNLSNAERNIMDNNMAIRINQRNIYANMDAIITSIPISQARTGQLQGMARDCQGSLDEDLAALVLYCQQFAWAPEMVGACAGVLTCAGRELQYRIDWPIVTEVYQVAP